MTRQHAPFGHTLLDFRALPLTDFSRTPPGEVASIAHTTGGLNPPLLEERGLTMYSHLSTRTFWLLLDAPGIHDHDRWQYGSLMSARGEYTGQWATLLSEQHDGGSGGWAFEELGFDMVAKKIRQWADVCSRINEFRTRLGHAPLNLAQVQTYGELLGTRRPGVLGHLPSDANFIELHDLIQHLPSWSARHPEATGLKLGLLLRMHGLSTVVDGAEQTDSPLYSHLAELIKIKA